MSAQPTPHHIAVVMDGNGRWAQKRFLPRVAGHRQGVEAVRALIRSAGDHGVDSLTVFAFSSENWQRPPEEVSFLMDLFLRALRDEVQKKIHEKGNFIGRSLPVFTAEREYGQRVNAMLARAADERSHRLYALTVPRYPRQKTLLRPSSIAVHDDGDMVRRWLGRHRRRV